MAFGWKYGASAAAAATPPTADAGADQMQAGLTQVTLDGAASTAGATMAWTLFDPSQTNKTSILSNSSLISPTFDPISSSASAGNWVANVAVTKDGLTSYDSVNILVGDMNGWITLFPDDAQQSSGSLYPYGIASWGRTGNWTTMTIGDKGATATIYPKACESKWYTLGVDWQNMTSIEFMVEADESYTQPTYANKVLVGAWLTTGSSTAQTVIPGWTGCQTMFNLSNRSENTNFSQRVSDQNFAWSSTSTGYNAFRWMYVKEYYADALDQVLYQKLDTVDPDNATMTRSDRTTTCTGTDKIKIAMAVGRNETDSEGVTAKFKVKYRLRTRS